MAKGSQGGGFFRLPDDEHRLLADVRSEFGDEAVEAVRRSLAMDEHGPRPLTDDERAFVRAHMAPLARDLAACDAILPDVREEAREDRGEQVVCAWIAGPDGSGTGISIPRLPAMADRLLLLAEQIQHWEGDQLAEAGRTDEWPKCTKHPGEHSLSPDSRDGVAVWVCPRTGHVVGQIGKLAGPATR